MEVVSPFDSAREVREKISDWLNFGVRMVWVLEPRKRIIKEYRLNKDEKPVRIFGEDDVLDGGHVVSEFSLPVCKVFD